MKGDPKPQFVRYFVKDPVIWGENFLYCGVDNLGRVYNVFRDQETYRLSKSLDFCFGIDSDSEWKWREIGL